MIFLYIASAFLALIILVLCFYLSLQIRYNEDGLTVLVGVGPVKVKLVPAKKKKINIKKAARGLKDKKLADVKKGDSTEGKKKKTTKKKSKDKKAKNSPATLIREMLGEDSDGMQTVRLILEFLRRTALEFDKKLHVDIMKLAVHIDCGNAHSTAVACGILSQTAAYVLEVLDMHAVVKIIGRDTVRIAPISNGGRSVYDIDLRVKMRTGSLIGHTVHLLFGMFKKLINKKIKVKI